MKVKMFLASRVDPFNGEFLLIVLHELAGPYSSTVWAFPDTSELSLCTTNDLSGTFAAHLF